MDEEPKMHNLIPIAELATEREEFEKSNPQHTSIKDGVQEPYKAPDIEEVEKFLEDGIGKFVKLSALSEDGTHKEIFWAELTKTDPPILEGIVNNDMMMSDKHGIKKGDYVKFGKYQIQDIFIFDE